MTDGTLRRRVQDTGPAGLVFPLALLVALLVFGAYCDHLSDSWRDTLRDEQAQQRRYAQQLAMAAPAPVRCAGDTGLRSPPTGAPPGLACPSPGRAR